MRVFGSVAYSHVPAQLRSKLDERSRRCVFVGYQPNSTGYKLLLDGKEIVVGLHVIFDETTKAGSKPPIPLSMEEPGDSSVEVTLEPMLAPAPELETADGEASNGSMGSDAEEGDKDTEEEDGTEAGPSSRRYPQRTRRKPTEWYKPVFAGSALAASLKAADPTTLAGALASPEAAEWQQAMDDEMASLAANRTWSLVPRPSGIRPISAKWVYKTKYTPDGAVERHKARLVARGFQQREGIDFDEVFAPVSKYSTLRALLAVVAEEDLELEQLDIKTAFLNGELKEEVYLEQPPGYSTGNLVCKLHKALYGLRQAPRAWHLCLKEELEAAGFQASSADPSLFFLDNKSGRIYLLVYVDDILVAGKDAAAVAGVKKRILHTFDARDMGAAGTFLGLDIVRDRANRTISLASGRAVRALVEEHQLSRTKPRLVPLALGEQLIKDDSELLSAEEHHCYRQLVGSLQHFAGTTRPDIAQAVGALARFNAYPTVVHARAAKVLKHTLPAGTVCQVGPSFGTVSILKLGFSARV
jgi:hypothetical protein